MKRWLLILALILPFAFPLAAQNVRFDLPIYTVQAQGGNLLPVYAIPGAGVKFYSCSGSTCTTLATTYISATSSTACPVSPTPMQVVLNGSNVCVSSADPYGNMGGWFQQGQYMATITAQGSSYNYFFTVGIAPGGVGCFPNTLANGCTGGASQLTANGSLGSTGPEINVAGYGAVGDCSGSESTASCTDNCTPLTNAFVAAYVAQSPVYFPVNPARNGQTVYYSSCTIPSGGVSFHGPKGSKGQSVENADQMLVAVRGAPGKDVFNVPDPGSVSNGIFKGGTVSDIGIVVDSSVDASASFTNRFPGKFCFDAVANGTAIVTSATCNFQPGDVGQAIKVGATTTTISSWQSLTQVTLAATVTAGTGLTAYVSVDGLSVTQTVGNCAFSMDASGLAGGYGNGLLGANFINVNIATTDGTNANNTCDFFFQGNTGPYQTIWQHDWMQGTFGFVFAPANTLAGQAGHPASGIADFNKFDTVWIQTAYPFIAYGGNFNRLENVQISGQLYGPQILLGNNLEVAPTPTSWYLDIPEMEGICAVSGTPPTTLRVAGTNYSVDRIGTQFCPTGVNPTLQWDASNSPHIDNLYFSATGGTFAVSGSHNQFSNPKFPNGGPSAYSVTGNGNTLVTCETGNPGFGQEAGRCQYAGLINTGVASTTFAPPQLSRGSVSLNRTHDFVDKGAAAYYFNDEDLWFWPNEVMDTGQKTTVVPDFSSETGLALSIVGTNSYTLDGANGTSLFYGSQVPAGKFRFYVMAKANTAITWSFNIASFSSGTGFNTLCGGAPSLTTSYAVYECDGDATPYPNTFTYLDLDAPGTGNTVSVAWIGIKPWYSDVEVNGPVNATSYQVAGAALATGNLADWTNSGVANGNVPVWNSGTGKWTPGSSSGAFSGGLGSSYQDATEIAAPANPSAGNDRLYEDSTTHQLSCLTSSGGSCMPSGGGGVSSVGLSTPSWLAVGGTPVTSSGTLAVTPATAQTSHKVIGTCGSATTFAPCSLVAADLPIVISGLTSGQVPIASSAAAITGSEALAGSGAGITTGPVSGTTAGHVVTEQGATGQIQDSGTLLSSLAPLASPALTGTPTAPTQTCASNTDIATGAYVAACGGGSGSMSDGSGTTTIGQFPETTSTAHGYSLNTPATVLTQIGAAPALACSTVSTLAVLAGSCYQLSTSASIALPTASSFTILAVQTESGATATFTGVTLTSDAGCSGFLSGGTLALTGNHAISFKSDGTSIWASCI